MLKALHAYLNLGSHLTLRIIKRLIGCRSPGLKQFFSFYKGDFIVPYRPEDKDPDFSRCILCGICDSLCPALKTNSGDQTLGPSFFPMISRSIPDFVHPLPQNFDEGCQGCRGCEEICPEKVPIKKIIGFMKNKMDQTR